MLLLAGCYPSAPLPPLPSRGPGLGDVLVGREAQDVAQGHGAAIAQLPGPGAEPHGQLGRYRGRPRG